MLVEFGLRGKCVRWVCGGSDEWESIYYFKRYSKYLILVNYFYVSLWVYFLDFVIF